MEPKIIIRKQNFFYPVKVNKKGVVSTDSTPLSINSLHHFGSDLVAIVVSASASERYQMFQEHSQVLDYIKSFGADYAYVGEKMLDRCFNNSGKLEYTKIISLYQQNYASTGWH